MGVFDGFKRFKALRAERRAEQIANPPERDRFTVEVTENLRGFGGAFNRSSSNALANYRVVVTDTETGVPQMVTQAPSYRTAHFAGSSYVDKILTGKRLIKGVR